MKRAVAADSLDAINFDTRRMRCYCAIYKAILHIARPDMQSAHVSSLYHDLPCCGCTMMSTWVISRVILIVWLTISKTHHISCVIFVCSTITWQIMAHKMYRDINMLQNMMPDLTQDANSILKKIHDTWFVMQVITVTTDFRFEHLKNPATEQSWYKTYTST